MKLSNKILREMILAEISSQILLEQGMTGIHSMPNYAIPQGLSRHLQGGTSGALSRLASAKPFKMTGKALRGAIIYEIGNGLIELSVQNWLAEYRFRVMVESYQSALKRIIARVYAATGETERYCALRFPDTPGVWREELLVDSQGRDHEIEGVQQSREFTDVTVTAPEQYSDPSLIDSFKVVNMRTGQLLPLESVLGRTITTNMYASSGEPVVIFSRDQAGQIRYDLDTGRPMESTTAVSCDDSDLFDRLDSSGSPVTSELCWPGFKAIIGDISAQGSDVYKGALRDIWNEETDVEPIASSYAPFERETFTSVFNLPGGGPDVHQIWNQEMKDAWDSFFELVKQRMSQDVGYGADLEHELFLGFGLGEPPGGWAPGCREVPGYQEGIQVPYRVDIQDIESYPGDPDAGGVSPVEAAAQGLETSCPTLIRWDGNRIYYNFEEWRSAPDCSWALRDTVTLSPSQGRAGISQIESALNSALGDGVFQGIQVAKSPEDRMQASEAELLRSEQASSFLRSYSNFALVAFRNDLAGDFSVRGIGTGAQASASEKILARIQMGINRWLISIFINPQLPVQSASEETGLSTREWVTQMEEISLGPNEVGQWGSHTDSVSSAITMAIRGANDDLADGDYEDQGLLPVFRDDIPQRNTHIAGMEAQEDEPGSAESFILPPDIEYRLLGVNRDPRHLEAGYFAYVALKARREWGDFDGDGKVTAVDRFYDPDAGEIMGAEQQEIERVGDDSTIDEWSKLQEYKLNRLIEQNESTTARLAFEEMKEVVLSSLEAIPNLDLDYEFVPMTIEGTVLEPSGQMTSAWTTENWDIQNILRDHAPVLRIWMRLHEGSVESFEAEAEEEIEAAMGTYG